MTYENEKKHGDEINQVCKKIDELKAKAKDAECKYDLSTALDLCYYALPDLQNRLKLLEQKKAAEDAEGTGSDMVTSEQIAEIVARWTSIPVTRLMSTKKEKLLHLEKVLAESVVGQPEAVKAVANAVWLSRSSLQNVARPIASFLMAGPSGTGKTLLSKSLVTLLFNSPDAMIRIDSSEYSEKHSISRLIGAPRVMWVMILEVSYLLDSACVSCCEILMHQPYRPIDGIRSLQALFYCADR